ncbi:MULTISPECIES: hypothetical protein [Wolbachia]|nr:MULTISPECIES: hypothetical protein [unclassified Wolbachia]
MRYLLSEERCNKAHWNPEKLIVHYTTFSIKSWIPVGFVASLK